MPTPPPDGPTTATPGRAPHGLVPIDWRHCAAQPFRVDALVPATVQAQFDALRACLPLTARPNAHAMQRDIALTDWLWAGLTSGLLTEDEWGALHAVGRVLLNGPSDARYAALARGVLPPPTRRW